MTRNSTSTFGALHPILFFVVVYSIALFLSLFVCRNVYYAFNPAEQQVEAGKKVMVAATTVALR